MAKTASCADGSNMILLTFNTCTCGTELPPPPPPFFFFFFFFLLKLSVQQNLFTISSPFPPLIVLASIYPHNPTTTTREIDLTFIKLHYLGTTYKSPT